MSSSASSASGSSFTSNSEERSGSSSGSSLSDSERPAPPTGDVHSTFSRGDGIMKVIETNPEVLTTHDAFMVGLEVNPNGKCLGTRNKTGGNENNPYVWITYQDVHDRMKNFGSGLLHLKAGEYIGIYSLNRTEWVIAEKACAAYSKVVVPLYDTLGQETLEYCCNLTKMDTLICEEHLTSVVLTSAKKLKSLKNLIQMGEITEENKKKAKAMKIKLIAFDEVESIGSENQKSFRKPKASTLMTICFTSGTTSEPKGVKLTHGMMIADLAGGLHGGLDIRKDDYHLSYLPLAHVFERIVQAGLFLKGAAIGFFRGDAKLLVDDMKELKPTILAAVPRVLNRIYDRITSQAAAACCCRAALFSAAKNKKLANLDKGSNTHWFYDKLVFKKVKQATGGNVRIIVTGSAPLGADVMRFCRIAFGATVYEGYGQTECCAACTLTEASDYSVGHVGVPLPCVEIALADVPDMDYHATQEGFAAANASKSSGSNSSAAAPAGDGPKFGGEICLRGPICTKGYFRNKKETQKAIDRSGWLHTGDIGIWTGENANKLKIVDRKKNIFKLAHGEYVAPEKIENILKTSPFIAYIWVYGNSLKNNVVAVIVPNPEKLKAWGAENKVSNPMDSPAFKAAVMADIKRIGSEVDEKGATKLKSFEYPAALHFDAEEWVQGSDVMTATYKLRRPQLKAKYEAEIDTMYEEIAKAEAARPEGGAGSQKKGK